MRGFLAGDLSARRGGYNERAGRGDPQAISLDDIVLVNSTMRSRAEHARWLPIIEADQWWLSQIPRDLDILETDDETWVASNGDQLLNGAIDRCIGPDIALARATKVLHLKRPRMFPVLDELVLQMMGVPVPTRADARGDAAQRVVGAIRRKGRWNAGAAPARVLETISPAGLESYFRELADIHASRGVRDPGLVADLQDRYGIRANVDWIAALRDRHGLKLLGE